jgi:hypothetical protein
MVSVDVKKALALDLQEATAKSWCYAWNRPTSRNTVASKKKKARAKAA